MHRDRGEERVTRPHRARERAPPHVLDVGRALVCSFTTEEKEKGIASRRFGDRTTRALRCNKSTSSTDGD